MRELNYSSIGDKTWDPELPGLIAAIHKEAGKQEVHLKQRSEELEKLVEIAKMQNAETSDAIEDIITTNIRIRQFVEEKTEPMNQDEQEITDYRDVLGITHESFNAIPVTRGYILQLHEVLYSHMNNPVAGRAETMQNCISMTYPDGHTGTFFVPLTSYETSDALNRSCAEYNHVIGDLGLEPLIAILVFIHDFLCTHPPSDRNGHMSRLLTMLLLYRNGFFAGKYIPLKAKIVKSKDLYYDALSTSQEGWHEGADNPVPFIRYLFGTILAAYRDFGDRLILVEIKRSAFETIKLATQNRIGCFTGQDIREFCPSLSVSSVEGALRKLVTSGELKREGEGKSIYYYRINQGSLDRDDFPLK